MGKKWYLSKTIWANIIALIALVLQVELGKEVIPAEQQAAILGIINILLRFVTKEELQ